MLFLAATHSADDRPGASLLSMHKHKAAATTPAGACAAFGRRKMCTVALVFEMKGLPPI
jgi:hypothetical protein